MRYPKYNPSNATTPYETRRIIAERLCDTIAREYAAKVVDFHNGRNTLYHDTKTARWSNVRPDKLVSVEDVREARDRAQREVVLFFELGLIDNDCRAALDGIIQKVYRFENMRGSLFSGPYPTVSPEYPFSDLGRFVYGRLVIATIHAVYYTLITRDEEAAADAERVAAFRAYRVKDDEANEIVNDIRRMSDKELLAYIEDMPDSMKKPVVAVMTTYGKPGKKARSVNRSALVECICNELFAARGPEPEGYDIWFMNQRMVEHYAQSLRERASKDGFVETVVHFAIGFGLQGEWSRAVDTVMDAHQCDQGPQFARRMIEVLVEDYQKNGQKVI